MSEPQNALGGARFAGLVEITEEKPRGMITLKGDLGSAKLKKAVTALAGVDMPEALRANLSGERGLFWMAPDELLLMGPYDAVAGDLKTLAKALKGTHHLAADVSDARSLFTISGPEGREVMAKLSPADMSPEGFGPGTFRRTRVGQVAAAVWMQDAETLGLICFRSVAQYVFDMLVDAAAPDARVDYF